MAAIGGDGGELRLGLDTAVQPRRQVKSEIRTSEIQLFGKPKSEIQLFVFCRPE